MSGGTINQNEATQNGGYGGGVYNCGKFYMCGNAVIGDKDATSVATAESYGNIATYGGGIYMNTQVDMTNVNVFGNTAKSNGGGIYFGSTSTNYTVGSSVTVAGNVCTGSGGGGAAGSGSTGSGGGGGASSYPPPPP